ncbi:MAG: RDD family protein [Candidatus Nanoarchaeia archaeon]
MSYPTSWRCPSCGASVYNSSKCTVCAYLPPSESGGLNAIVKEKDNHLFRRRIIAFLIDISFIISIGLLISLSASLAFINSGKSIETLMSLFSVPAILIMLFLHPIYFLLLEARYSATYGKKLMKIKVTDNGFSVSAKRNLTRFIEAIPLYIPSILMIRKDGKRWGDKLAMTNIIKE